MEALLKDILAGNYTTVEAQDKANELVAAGNEQFTAVARKYAKVLNSDAGRDMMAHLRSITVDKPDGTLLDQNLPYAFAHRAGQNSIYHWLNAWVQKAERADNEGSKK